MSDDTVQNQSEDVTKAAVGKPGNAVAEHGTPAGSSGDQRSLFADLPAARYPTGILPSQDIEELIATGAIAAPLKVQPNQVQPASLDLRLGPIGYRVRASFLPGASLSVATRLAELSMHEFDLTRPTVLERGCVYVVPLLEQVSLPRDISAAANPKSSIGRLDVFTRLITDYGELFETITPGYRGKLYLEIVPRTFSIQVEQGAKLTQIRFSRGFDAPSSDRVIARLHRDERIVFESDESEAGAMITRGLKLGIDLRPGDESGIVGYRAKHNCPVIDLERIAFYESSDFWERLVPSGGNSLVLHPGEFYILVSKQRVRIPVTHAAEMVPIDPSVGEFRVHYAGFFDPGFGYGDAKGTPAVLEVRSHDVPFFLEDGQVIARLRFQRLLEVPAKSYGAAIGSSYSKQGLALSKYFR